MKQNNLYHWTDKKGFEFIKKYGIRGEEGWLYTLLNDETGGLEEYIRGRTKKGEPTYGIRIDLSHIIQNNSGSCFIDHNTRIGHPSNDKLQHYENICKIERCKSGCDINEKYKNHENYIDYFYEKFEECGNERKWSKDKIKILATENLARLLELKSPYGCVIKPANIEYTKIDDIQKGIPKNLKYKKISP